jgi:hypothetical protein
LANPGQSAGKAKGGEKFALAFSPVVNQNKNSLNLLASLKLCRKQISLKMRGNGEGAGKL